MKISKYDDVIDSRDVIERIEELQSERDACTMIRDDGSEEPDPDGWADQFPEDAAELAELEALAEEASSSPDWRYGEALIRDSYFRDYAEQLADDIGAIDRSATWPLSCIDWEQAADELKVDYSCVDFGGVAYWIRA